MRSKVPLHWWFCSEIRANVSTTDPRHNYAKVKLRTHFVVSTTFVCSRQVLLRYGLHFKPITRRWDRHVLYRGRANRHYYVILPRKDDLRASFMQNIVGRTQTLRVLRVRGRSRSLDVHSSVSYLWSGLNLDRMTSSRRIPPHESPFLWWVTPSFMNERLFSVL